jgi:hypothetical protein
MQLEMTDPAWCIRERLQFNQSSDLANLVKHLFAAMADGRKIEAIKAFRSLTGNGLKESKDAIESVMHNAPKPVHDSAASEYGHFVFLRGTDDNFESTWTCKATDETRVYADRRAKEVCEYLTPSESLYVMKVLAVSSTVTTMRNVD